MNERSTPKVAEPFAMGQTYLSTFNGTWTVYTREREEGLQGRLVTGSKRDGCRNDDEHAKCKLIQVCLKFGASIARAEVEKFN
jgi:hypothetical protein